VPQPSDRIEHVADEAVHKELGDSLVRVATTASSLEAKQNSGNINRTQSKATPNESSSQETSSGGGPIVINLEKKKTTQANEIDSLKRSMGRNLDNLSRKFLMYPRFIQVFLDNQIDGISNHERKYVSSSRTKKFFRNMRRIEKCFSERITPLFLTMVVQSLGEGSAMPTDPYYTPIILHSSSQPQKTHKPKKPTRKVTEVPQPSDRIEHVADEAVHKELGDSLVRVATTASSLEAKQNSGNINRTQSKATPNESSSQETSSGGGPMC
nr:hypothetical protein [Tanacetum cinerariifolium]